MRLFLDTEFTGLHQYSSLISLAIVSSDNHEFYAEFTDFETSQLNDWLKENVLSNLIINQNVFMPSQVHIRGNKLEVLSALKEWLLRYDTIEFVCDVGMYDWMLFCQLFGGAMEIPPNVSYIPLDFATVLWSKGINPNTTRETLLNESQINRLISRFTLPINKHNALYDTHLLKECFESIY